MNDADVTPLATKAKHMTKIQIVNHSTLVGPAELATAVAACGKQLNGEFAVAHGIGPTALEILKAGAAPDPEAQQHGIFDVSTSPGALGFHQVDSRGRPVGFTFVKSTIEDGGKWTTTLSHELMEQRLDAYCSLWTQTPDNKMRAFEMCDAVEADEYTIKVGDDEVTVSNFLHPEYFAEQLVVGMRTDHMDTLKGQIAPARSPGGYDIVINTKGQVSQEFSDHAMAMSAHKRDQKSFAGSRTSLRLAHAARLAAAAELE